MRFIMFYGASCPHCHKTMPAVDKLIKEGLEIEKKEVWGNQKNAMEMREFRQIIIPSCSDGLGVPSFVDVKKKRALCGEQSYKELKKWLLS